MLPSIPRRNDAKCRSICKHARMTWRGGKKEPRRKMPAHDLSEQVRFYERTDSRNIEDTYSINYRGSPALVEREVGGIYAKGCHDGGCGERLKDKAGEGETHEEVKTISV